MKRKDMEELRALREELDTLKTKYLRMPSSEHVGDTYGDYRSGRKVIKVAYGDSSERKDRLRDKIEKKAERIEEKIRQQEEFLEEVEDSTMRDILRLYYAEGMSQAEIGKRKGYSRSAIGAKIDRFWNDR